MDKVSTEWAKDIPCRNVIIYGYCKKENDGCVFRHDDDIEKAEAMNSGTSDTASGVANVVTTTLKTEKVKVSSNLASVANISTVVSSTSSAVNSGIGGSSQIPTSSSSALGVTSSPTPGSLPKFNAKVSASFTPKGAAPELSAGPAAPAPSSSHAHTFPVQGHANISSFAPAYDAYSAKSFTPTPSSSNLVKLPISSKDSLENHFKLSISQMSAFPNSPPVSAPPLMNMKYPTIYPPPHSLLQYHLYAPDPPPHFNLSLKPNERLPESLFIPNNIREQMVKKNMAALRMFPPGGALPDIVQDYFGFVPLDFNKTQNVGDHYNGHKNTTYKVFSNLDGNVYFFRRVHDVKLVEPSHLVHTIQSWSSVSNANVVKLKDLFITSKFGDSSLCAVYDYYPTAPTLYEYHFVNLPLVPLTQKALWTYLVQLTSALRAIHQNKLHIGKLLNWDKIIVTGDPFRIKITGCEPLQVLTPNQLDELDKLQNDDFLFLGQLLKRLAATIKSTSLAATTDELAVDDDFKNVLAYLLDESNDKKSVKDLSSLFLDKIFDTLEASQGFTEYAESVLSKELENGRLFRLMCKLNAVFGRMESRVDVNWSESGEKFPIILFYDFVFHQLDESGKPIMDLTHVLRCLNKLDAGVQEKIMLVTPDEMNCIIISYKELKDLLDYTFRTMS